MSEPSLVLRARRLRAARGVVARDVSLAASPGDVVPVEGPLRMSTHPATLATPVGDQVAWSALPGLLLAAAAALAVTRLT